MEVGVREVGEESEATRLTGGGRNCFFWDEGGIKDDGLAKGLSFEEFLRDVKNPLVEDISTLLPNVW